MSLRIAIIAEGPTDVAVVENVVSGATNDRNNSFTYVKPTSVIGPHDESEISNWSQVMAYCQSNEFRDLAHGTFVDLIIIQVDTDQYDAVHFNLPTHEDGVETTPERKYELAIGIIISWIGSDLFVEVQGRIVFAISVDSIECWLLPIYFPNNKAKRGKTKNCFNTLISHDRTRTLMKTYQHYQSHSRPYAKASTLAELANLNFSLGRFVTEVMLRLGLV